MKSPPPVGAVLFDLDGTLLDTAPDMVSVFDLLCIEAGVPVVDFTTARAQVSNGSTGLLRLRFAEAGTGRFETLRARYLELYRENLAVRSALFPGGADMLASIEQRGLPWGIVTNKPGWLAEPLLEALGLRERAASVVCGDTLPERKPHPLPLLHAAQEIGVAPERCAYVGDALRDVQAARSAGMRPIVASFGYIDEGEPHEQWPAEAWIDTPAGLLDWLDRA